MPDLVRVDRQEDVVVHQEEVVVEAPTCSSPTRGSSPGVQAKHVVEVAPFTSHTPVKQLKVKVKASKDLSLLRYHCGKAAAQHC